MLVWVMDGLRQGCYMTIWRWNESPVTFEHSQSLGEIGKFDRPCNSSWQLVGMPHQGDGLPLFLSAIACLFGSWMS